MAKSKTSKRPSKKLKQMALSYNAFLDPPEYYEDDPPEPHTLEVEKTLSDIMGGLSATQVRKLIDVLAPQVRKVWWYRTRYETVLAEKRKLAAENEELISRMDQLRRRTGLGSADGRGARQPAQAPAAAPAPAASER